MHVACLSEQADDTMASMTESGRAPVRSWKPVSRRRFGHVGALVPGFVLLCLCLVGCGTEVHSEMIRVSAETVNTDGLFARVEYLRDGEVTNSVHLVDGNGDGVIDGKSGPREEGNWPPGWEWFDDMYSDVVVGQTAMVFDGTKVTVTEAKTYEFIVGEYQCRGLG